MGPEADARQPSWFWLDDIVIDRYAERIGPVALALYTTLVRHAKKNGQAYPSLRRLQKLLQVSRTTIVKYLELLEAEGLITREKRWSTDGDMTSTMYTVLPLGGGPAGEPRGPADEPPGPRREPQVVQHVNHGGPAREPEGIRFKELDLKEDPPIAPPRGKRTRKPAEYSQGFNAFWTVYPPTRKKGKAQAWAIWQRDHLEAQADDIVAKVVALRQYDQAFMEGYEPEPHRWLNKKRYTDDILTGPTMPLMHRTAAPSRTQQRDAANIEATFHLEDLVNGSNGRQNIRTQPRPVGHGVQRRIGSA